MELISQTSRATSIRDDIELISPLVAEDFGQEVVVSNSGNTIVRVIRGHDGPGTTVENRALQGREVKTSQLTFTSMNRRGVDALLGRSKSGLMD